MKINISESEVLRLLGMKPTDADENIINEIRSIHKDIEERCTPRSVWKTCTLEASGEHFSFGGLELDSHSLSLNLKGCTKIVMLAVTIGIECDMYIKRLKAVSMARSVIAQSVAAEYVEQYCNIINDKITKEALSEGYKTHTRFSPGYGDFLLEYQPAFLQSVNATKEIGITLADSLMMIPSKSITAVIGLEPIERT